MDTELSKTLITAGAPLVGVMVTMAFTMFTRRFDQRQAREQREFEQREKVREEEKVAAEAILDAAGVAYGVLKSIESWSELQPPKNDTSSFEWNRTPAELRPRPTWKRHKTAVEDAASTIEKKLQVVRDTEARHRLQYAARGLLQYRRNDYGITVYPDLHCQWPPYRGHLVQELVRATAGAIIRGEKQPALPDDVRKFLEDAEGSDDVEEDWARRNEELRAEEDEYDQDHVHFDLSD